MMYYTKIRGDVFIEDISSHQELILFGEGKYKILTDKYDKACSTIFDEDENLTGLVHNDFVDFSILQILIDDFDAQIITTLVEDIWKNCSFPDYSSDELWESETWQLNWIFQDRDFEKTYPGYMSYKRDEKLADLRYWISAKMNNNNVLKQK